MGVDIEVIAFNSKVKFNVDREGNLKNFISHEETDQELIWDIWRAAFDINYGVSKGQIALLATQARRSWELTCKEKPDQAYRIDIIDRLLEVIGKCPDDETFYIVSDATTDGEHPKFANFNEVDLCL